MTHLYVRHDSFIRETWLIHMCTMTHSWLLAPCVFSVCEIWLVHETQLNLDTWDMTHSYKSPTWDMTPSYIRHDSFIHETRLIHIWGNSYVCDVTHSYAWRDSFMIVTWPILKRDMTYSYVWHGSFICVTWLIHKCDTTHSYVRHDLYISVTWLIHDCPWLPAPVYRLCVWHDEFICETWLIHKCDMTHSWLPMTSSPCVSSMCVTWRIHMWDMTHS